MTLLPLPTPCCPLPHKSPPKPSTPNDDWHHHSQGYEDDPNGVEEDCLLTHLSSRVLSLTAEVKPVCTPDKKLSTHLSL